MEKPLLLVVEDEPILLVDLADVLETAGFKVLPCSTMEKALAALEESPRLHGLVTDIRLGGGGDGSELARTARDLMPELPVVYMSGDSAADWSARGVPNSVILQKPFASAQVTTAIAQLLNDLPSSEASL